MRKLPPLATLRAFEAAARHMSFKDAADELGVTPTAISHQIRLLEEICGRDLFRRRPRPLTLTTAGERLFPVLRNGLDAFAMAFAALSDEQEARPLRVTSPNAFASRWLVPRLPLWREAHPDVPLEVIGTDALIDLRAGEADVAIRYARTAPTEFISREVFRDRYFPVCSPALLAGRHELRATDLLQYPLIHYDWFSPGADTPSWRQWWATARIVDPGLPDLSEDWALRFREELHAVDAVIAGQGIAICSDVVLADALRDGTLCRAHELTLPGFGFYLTHLPDTPRKVGHRCLPRLDEGGGVRAAVPELKRGKVAQTRSSASGSRG